MSSFLSSPVTIADGGCLQLVRVGDRVTVARRLEAAIDSPSRRRGLLGRDDLPPDAAIAIAPTSAVHTFFMRFALDIAFVARDGRVLRIYRNVRPWRMAWAPGAFAAVEFAAGAPGAAALAPGDCLRVVRVSSSRSKRAAMSRSTVDRRWRSPAS